MALEDKLNYAAGLMFDNDPLANMVTSGLYKGGSFVGQKAKAGLERLRRKTKPGDPEPPMGDMPEAPVRATKGDSESDGTTSQDNKQNWDWLRGILTELSTSLSSIKDILSESLKHQINEQERLSLATKENDLENRNKKNTIVTKKEQEEGRGGILGIMGVLFAGLASGLTALISALTNPLLLGGLALLAASMSDKNSWIREKVGAGTEWIKEKLGVGGVDATTISTNAVMSGAEKGMRSSPGAMPKPEETPNKPTKSEKREIRRNAKRAAKGLSAKVPEVSIPKAGVTTAATSALKDGAKVGAKALVRTAGRTVPIISGALSAGERIADGQGALQVAGGVAGEMAGGTGGAWAGGTTGAAIGTMIFPGVGTAIGAGIGAIAGGIVGSIGGGWISDKITGVENDSEEPKLAKEEAGKLNESTKELNETSEGLQKSNNELKSSVDLLRERLDGVGISSNVSANMTENDYVREPMQRRFPSNIKTNTSFDNGAHELLPRLMKDLNLNQKEAAAILGNLGHESMGLKPGIQEMNPLRGRGGLGYAQWTGIRRRRFEAFAKARGTTTKDPETNYQFLIHELRTTHRKSLEALKRAPNNTISKTIAFEQQYEGSGVKAYASRVAYAKRAEQLIANPDMGRAAKLNEVSKANKNAEQAQQKVVVVKTGGDSMQAPPMLMPSPTPNPQSQVAEVRCSIDGSVSAACRY